MIQTIIPRGVTVRKITDPEPDFQRPRNALERAAMCDDLATVKTIFSELLGLSPDSKLAAIYLSEPARWKRLAPWARLDEIGKWLKAECFELMDLVSVPDISTRGD